MFCSSCGTRNEEGTAYRVGCGAELRKIQTPSVEVPPLDTGDAGLSAGRAAGPGASVPNMPDYLVQAVLLTLVCFVPSPFTLFFPFPGVITGIVAIVYGAQVNGKVGGNNYAGARESSHMARVWTWITLPSWSWSCSYWPLSCSYSSSRWPREAAPPSHHALEVAGSAAGRGAPSRDLCSFVAVPGGI